MLTYSIKVLRSYIRKYSDGTLWSLRRLEAEGAVYKDLYQLQAARFLEITPKDTRTRTVADFKAMMHDPEQWDRLETRKLAPCFEHVPDFHPFEQPGTHLETSHVEGALIRPVNDNGFGEDDISPDTLIRLSLSKIEHRFPSGDDDLPGDGDIRALIAAQTQVFTYNYRHLNRRRLSNVRAFMRAAQVVQALWTLWFLEDCVKPEDFRPLHAGLDYLGFNPEGANPLVSLLGNPIAFVALTALIYVAMLATAGYFHALQRQRFAAFMRSSSATVSKSVTTRQDNLVYLTRAMMEEMDRGKEEAWDRNRLKAWATETQRWAKLVFWCDQRIEANEEHLRIHMKLVGLAYAGLRSEARFQALMLIAGHGLLGLLTALAGWTIGFDAFGWHLRDAADTDFLVDAGCYGLATLAFLTLLTRLHSLVRAIDPPQAVNDLIQWASTRYMKGWRDSALYREVAEFITRDKRRLLHEEEKRRAA